MAVSNLTITQLGSSLFQDTNNAATVVQVKATSTTIYGVTVDNSANAAATYVKLFNATSGSVTLGTTAPDEIYLIASSAKQTLIFPSGRVFATALSVASVTTGGTAGTTGPTSAVTVNIAYT